MKTCPFCKYQSDQYSNLTAESKKAKPGDYTVCLSCANICQLNDQLEFVGLDEYGLLKMCVEEPELWDEVIKIQQNIRAMKRESRGNARNFPGTLSGLFGPSFPLGFQFFPPTDDKQT